MRRSAHGDVIPRGQRGLPRALLVATVSLLWLASLAVPAGAHAALEETVPADDEEVRQAPDEVALVFSEPMQPPARIEVTDPEGASVVAGEPEIDGPRVSAPLEPLDVAGTYTVEWRAVSADDHPLEGALTFDVAETSEDPAADTGEQATEEDGDEEQGVPEAESEDGGEAGDAPGQVAQGEGLGAGAGSGGEGSAPAAAVLPWLLAAAGAAAVGGAGATAVAQRRHSSDSADPG